MIIQPARRVRGRLRLPGDKSISHRTALLAAAARGRTRITNYATSEDCASTLACLRQLGVHVRREGTSVTISGKGLSFPAAPPVPLNCGNSGTTMRLLAGLLAGQPFTSTLSGDDSLRSRPMRRIIEPLEQMGARVNSTDGRAPLRVEGRRSLRPINYELPVASAQVKSCILLAGLNAAGRTEIVERDAPTRDHTERLLRWFGVEVETELKTSADGDGALKSRHVVALEGGQELTARDVEVPGDISSAAFFLAAAALLPGSDLTIEGVGLNPTRTHILDALRDFGAEISIVERRREAGGEEAGDLRGRDGDLSGRGLDGEAARAILSGEQIAGLIDELPILAVVGSQLAGGLEIRDAAELRVKETDRISATVANLRAMGAEVEERDDGMLVGGPSRLRGARLDARGDHRIAMAFTVAALSAEGPSEIDGADCVRISFPEFYTMLDSLVER
ncbi:MAG: 3-phosphoshikimate 1-carboxyvinyltransferase [Pyrinomonadaceae bacterium]